MHLYIYIYTIGSIPALDIIIITETPSLYILFVVIIILVAIGAFWIHVLNKRHAATRERMGKSAHVVDLSMENSSSLKAQDAIFSSEDGAIGDKAFDDVTDLKNEDFIYVY